MLRLSHAFPLASGAATTVAFTTYVDCHAAPSPSHPASWGWRPAWQFDLDYRLEQGRELGSGGYGHVYLAMHKSGVSRAVKRVRLDDDQADAALRKEFEIMKKLQVTACVALAC